MYTCIHKHTRTKKLNTHVPFVRIYKSIQTCIRTNIHTHTRTRTYTHITALFNAILAYTFFGLHEVARQMETPFGEEEQSLPLDAISRFFLFYILRSKMRFALSLSASFVNVATGWPRVIGCLIFIGHFQQNSPITNNSYAENNMQLKTSYGFSPRCTRTGSMTMCMKVSVLMTGDRVIEISVAEVLGLPIPPPLEPVGGILM